MFKDTLQPMQLVLRHAQCAQQVAPIVLHQQLAQHALQAIYYQVVILAPYAKMQDVMFAPVQPQQVHALLQVPVLALLDLFLQFFLVHQLLHAQQPAQLQIASTVLPAMVVFSQLQLVLFAL
jgi:hypothetical protein